MSEDKKNGNGNGNGNGKSGHRVIQFAPPPTVQQQPQQPQIPQKVGSASVVAKLKELLAVAESGRFKEMVFIGIANNGDITVSWSNLDAVTGKVYLLGAMDMAQSTLINDVFRSAKKG